MRTFAIVSLFCAALAWLALVTMPASARDRPSPPDNVLASDCGYYSPMTAPWVCVFFRNTASERSGVAFWLEWTLNGQKMPGNFADLQTECIQDSAQAYDCFAATEFRQRAISYEGDQHNVPSGTPGICGAGWPRAVPCTTKEREKPEGIRIKSALFDSDYCFRFKAVTDSGVVSDNWSAEACMHTRAAPPVPHDPVHPPRVTVLPGTSGAGQPGNGTAAKILVEWSNASADGQSFVAPADQGLFVVEVSDPSQYQNKSQMRREWQEAGSPKTTDLLEVRLDRAGLSDAARFRVCVKNVSGKSCSGSAGLTNALESPDALKQTPGVETNKPNDTVHAKNPAPHSVPPSALRVPRNTKIPN